ncbi:transmembrane protein, putative [Medicago truncatula]|uniref:Transmembrane protein, putative n=1 Tax=Medicago truncatula TaxID=3880 RepID=A0A072UWB5_MEDTR|nr:transmembrane protein, putative [Medicago truncatula]
MSMPKAYTLLMTLELGSIGIKYQADLTLPSTMIIFHFSGIVACETLLWILLPEFWNWYIINIFLLMVTTFCFFNYIHSIVKLFLPTNSRAVPIAQPPNPESQQEAQNSANIKQYYATCFSRIAGMVLFGGLLAPNIQIGWLG